MEKWIPVMFFKTVKINSSEILVFTTIKPKITDHFNAELGVCINYYFSAAKLIPSFSAKYFVELCYWTTYLFMLPDNKQYQYLV